MSKPETPELTGRKPLGRVGSLATFPKETNMSQQSSVAAWQLDGNSAGAYEEYLVGRIFRRWAQRLVAHANARSGERVLDAGCGTGIVARTAAGHVVPGGEVVGLDLNDDMIAEARRRDTGGSVTWRTGDVEDLPFSDGSFDLVLIEQVLQFTANREKALAEALRVLAPGGRLVFSLFRELEFNRSYAALADALDRHVGPEAGSMMRSPFAGPHADVIRNELETTGFANVTIHHDILDVRYPNSAEYLREEAASSPLAGPLGKLDDERIAALITELDSVLAPFTDDEGVTFPMETFVVIAYR